MSRKETIKDRNERLLLHETECWNTGRKDVAGIDEAGRGPLAGPVVAAAVIIEQSGINGVYDSKKLTPAQRNYLFDKIMKEARGVGIGIVDNNMIDDINIYQATLLAAQIAVSNLPFAPDFLLVDGMSMPKIAIPGKKIVRGDSLSQSIAAASIIAKVTRDRIMEDYHKEYPQYNLLKHKGYGTKEHVDKIREFGPSPIHRKTFKIKELRQMG